MNEHTSQPTKGGQSHYYYMALRCRVLKFDCISHCLYPDLLTYNCIKKTENINEKQKFEKFNEGMMVLSLNSISRVRALDITGLL